uniref:hypothetical protein n=1 Tax=Pseudonocardia sp. CA-138482 TaxID=3240023 RepID=UPI003F492CB8
MSVTVVPMCRWCREPVEPEAGRFVGADGEAVCQVNTTGCGSTCGFFCGCDGLGWRHGDHDPWEKAA